ncbi:MAG: helix-turn-helix domain-containing protein, partial [Planctomycetaceae bacterium]|nr:helix-turn-helix domain-containing protein [Planctomycetaceae bacterium]
YVVFTDATLRSLAKLKPTDGEELLDVQGIGRKKAADYGAEVLSIVATHGGNSAGVGGIEFAVPKEKKKSTKEKVSRPSQQKQRAWKMFTEGASIEDVREAAGVTHPTIISYLEDYIEHEGITDPSRWIPPEIFAKISAAAETTGYSRLKPLFEALAGTVSYDYLHIATATLKNLATQQNQE